MGLLPFLWVGFMLGQVVVGIGCRVVGWPWRQRTLRTSFTNGSSAWIRGRAHGLIALTAVILVGWSGHDDPLAHRGSRLNPVHVSESTVLRVLMTAGVHLPGRPGREARPPHPWPEWVELVQGVVWIYDFTHFTAAGCCAVAVMDVISRY